MNYPEHATHDYWVAELTKRDEAIQRVRDLGNERCDDKCSSLSCRHYGIDLAIRALDGKKLRRVHSEEIMYCAAEDGEQA